MVQSLHTQSAQEDMICYELLNSTLPKTLVIGVGGAGNNLISRLFDTGISTAQCIAINTDRGHLETTHAHQKLLVGSEITNGIGTKGNPEIGKCAVEDSFEKIAPLLFNMDTVFIIAGMGGGTGTGAAPFIAEMAQKTGAVVTSLVTMPLECEKKERLLALQGLENIRDKSDTTIVFDNNRPIEIIPGLVSESILSMADATLINVLKGLSDSMATSNFITETSEIRDFLKRGGLSLAGLGESNSIFRVEEAARNAIQSPFLGIDRLSPKGALVFVTGSYSRVHEEATRVVEVVNEALPGDVSIVLGSRIDPSLESILRVTLVLAGVDYWKHYVGGDRRMPFNLYNIEPEVGKDQYLDLDLDLDQMESD